MNNGLKVAMLALACFATSISEFAIVGMIDVAADSAHVSVAMAGQLLTFGLNLFWVSGNAVLYSYITPFLQEGTVLDAAALSAVLLAFGASALVGNKLGGWLCDRFGMRQVALIALTAQVVILYVLFLMNGPIWLVVAAVLVWGVFAWVPSPIINLTVVKAAPEAADVMLSLNNSTTQFAYAIGAGAGGIVVAGSGAHPLCLVAVVMLGLAMAAGFFATKPEGEQAISSVAAQEA